MKTYRVVVVESRTGERKGYRVKAVDAGDAIDRINRKYRGDQPVEVIWVKVVL